MKSQRPLPIDPLLPEIIARLKSHRCLLLQASPGSGKTTRVPPALLDSGLFTSDQEIWVLVPRRLAARTAAFRVAEERGEKVGQSVGYQFRFEQALSAGTRLKFLTEGMLFRLLSRSPELSHVGLVILDEFHERHLHTDAALSYLRWLQGSRRPDLKLLVMSATLDTEPISKFLEDCPVLNLESPPYPVDVSHISSPPSQPLELLVKRAVTEALSKEAKPGDVLVFLPGMAEIRRSEEALSAVDRRIRILPLHGDLSRDVQDQIFEKSGIPKVILATNVAETSITIDGVTTVIDGGLHRQASYSWWNGVPALKTRPISKASALQRAGRAGRTAPGKALRLYTQADFEGRPAFDLPEILRSDLSQTLLEMKAFGIGRMSEFRWLDTPPPSSLQAAAELLFRLGALPQADLDQDLSPLGREMAKLPLHPRLSRMLFEGRSRGVLSEAALLAALIGEEALQGLDALQALEAYPPSEGVERARKQLFRYLSEEGESREKRVLSAKKREALALALLAGFPDRVAKKRESSRGVSSKNRVRTAFVDLVFASGGSGEAPLDPLLEESEYFVTVQVQEKKALGMTQSKVHVTSLCPLRPEWLLDLPAGLLEERTDLIWEKDLGRVVQRSRITYGQLILSESREKPTDSRSAEIILLREGLGLEPKAGSPMELLALLQAFSRFIDDPMIEETLARVELFSRFEKRPEISLSDGEEIRSFALKLFEGFDSFAALQDENWPQKILSFFPPAALARIARLLPNSLELAGGRGSGSSRRVRIHYAFGKPPWVESRLQDFFGMRKGPSLMEGKLPLSLHLLAPSRRPVQVTNDLESFWKNAYPKIRRELCRKYPKHAWPEDPLA